MALFDIVAILVGIAGGVLAYWGLRARDEELHASERRPDPAVWIIDRAGYWWVPLDRGGYVAARPEPMDLARRRLDPPTLPRAVTRRWIDREVGIRDVFDPPYIPEAD